MKKIYKNYSIRGVGSYVISYIKKYDYSDIRSYEINSYDSLEIDYEKYMEDLDDYKEYLKNYMQDDCEYKRQILLEQSCYKYFIGKIKL